MKGSRFKNKCLFAFEKTEYNRIIHNTKSVNPKVIKYQYHLQYNLLNTEMFAVKKKKKIK